jgi:FAD/FMN-containing dehydrogenase
MTTEMNMNGQIELRDSAAIAILRRNLNGAVVLPGDKDYERERHVWNGLIDTRPAAIVRPANATNVARVVAFARDNQLLLAVRSGGHSPAGHGTVDGGILVDLSAMKALHIDPKRRVAQAQSGLTWGEYAAAAQAHDTEMATVKGMYQEVRYLHLLAPYL